MIEKLFEGMLWNSRFVVLIAVIAGLVTSLFMFYIASVDVFYLAMHLGEYASADLTGNERENFRSATVTHVVEVIDGYLLAVVLLLFALGLYELFISKIDQAKSSETQSVLVIRNLDDLKARLGRVILMILIVNFFEHAINMSFENALELLALAASVAFIGLTLYFTHSESDK